MYDFPMDAIAIAPSDLPSWSVEGWYATVDREGLEFFVYNIDGAVIDQTDLPEGITVSSDGTISAEATIGPNAGKKLTLTFLVGESKVNSALAGHASPCNRGG